MHCDVSKTSITNTCGPGRLHKKDTTSISPTLCVGFEQALRQQHELHDLLQRACNTEIRYENRFCVALILVTGVLHTLFDEPVVVQHKRIDNVCTEVKVASSHASKAKAQIVGKPIGLTCAK